MVLIYGMRHSFSVFFPSILDEFGWGRGSTAVMFSLTILTYGLMAPVAGRLGDHWAPRKAMTTGLVILGLAVAGCGLADELWHFRILFGVLAPIGMALSGWPLLGPALANWFASKRGLVIGIGQIGGGFSFAYGIFAEYCISQLGWRNAYFVLAAILVTVLIPTYILFFRYRPEDKGLTAYGEVEEPAAVNNLGLDYWTLGRALKTYQLWFLILSVFFFWGIGVYLVLAHQIKFAQDVGYSRMLAVSVFGLFGIFMVAGQVSSAISDYIGRETVTSVAAVLGVVAMMALFSVNDASRPWLLYFHAVCLGLGAGLFSATIYVCAADMFHGKEFGSISGLLLTGMGIGGAIGPWLGGYIYDVSGSYKSAFILCLVSFGFAGLAVLIAAPRRAAEMHAGLVSDQVRN
jgi:MFS family permease